MTPNQLSCVIKCYQVLMDSVCARVLRDFTDKERAQYGIDDKEPTCPAIK